MNYKQPRQRNHDQRFDYTNKNDGFVYPIGYCHEFQELDKHPVLSGYYQEGRRKTALYANKDKYHTTGHDTYEEACNCYKEFILDNELQISNLDNSTLYKCDISGCGAYSNILVSVGRKSFFACTGHANREEIAKILVVGESISS